MDHLLHVSARHVVGFKLVARDVAQSGFVGLDHGGHDGVGRHVADAHQEELDEGDVHSRHFGGKPEEERYVMEEHGQKDDGSYGYEHER